MTPFGQMLRQERRERSMLLSTLAEGLSISPPYLSQLETGQKPLTEDFVERVIRFLEFGPADAQALRRAAARSLPASSHTVTIKLKPDADQHDRELASKFALVFNRLKPEAKAKLRDVLRDETNG